MKTEILTEKEYCTSPFKKISWSAIFVGAIVAVGLSFLLNLFGLAIGLTAFTVSKTGGYILTMGGIIGIIISIFIAMGVAGYTAGYLGRCYTRCNLGILYGFTTWTVALLITAVIASHVNNYTITYSKNLGATVSNTNQSTTEAKPAVVETGKNTTATTAATTMTSTEDLAKGAFILFAMFFLSALSTCIGACLAMGCKKDLDRVERREI